MVENGINKENASVRETTRASAEVKAADVKRLLEDPAFKGAFSDLRENMVSAIENHKSDGSKEDEATQVEYCRTLRTLKAIENQLHLTVNTQTLRENNFRSGVSETQEQDKN